MGVHGGIGAGDSCRQPRHHRDATGGINFANNQSRRNRRQPVLLEKQIERLRDQLLLRDLLSSDKCLSCSNAALSIQAVKVFLVRRLGGM